MDRTTFNKMLGVAAFAGLTEPNESNAQSVGHVFLSKLSGEEVTLSDVSLAHQMSWRWLMQVCNRRGPIPVLL